jgi:hypothetical protein
MEEAESLLPDADRDEPPPPPPAKMQQKYTTLGTVRAYWLGSVVCMGGFLFGYDSGM